MYIYICVCVLWTYPCCWRSNTTRRWWPVWWRVRPTRCSVWRWSSDVARRPVAGVRPRLEKQWRKTRVYIALVIVIVLKMLLLFILLLLFLVYLRVVRARDLHEYTLTFDKRSTNPLPPPCKIKTGRLETNSLCRQFGVHCLNCTRGVAKIDL